MSTFRFTNPDTQENESFPCREFIARPREQLYQKIQKSMQKEIVKLIAAEPTNKDTDPKDMEAKSRAFHNRLRHEDPVVSIMAVDSVYLFLVGGQFITDPGEDHAKALEMDLLRLIREAQERRYVIEMKVLANKNKKASVLNDLIQDSDIATFGRTPVKMISKMLSAGTSLLQAYTLDLYHTSRMNQKMADSSKTPATREAEFVRMLACRETFLDQVLLMLRNLTPGSLEERFRSLMTMLV